MRIHLTLKKASVAFSAFALFGGVVHPSLAEAGLGSSLHVGARDHRTSCATAFISGQAGFSLTNAHVVDASRSQAHAEGTVRPESLSQLHLQRQPKEQASFEVDLAVAQIQLLKMNWDLSDPWQTQMRKASEALLQKHVPRLRSRGTSVADQARIRALVSLLSKLTNEKSEEILAHLDLAIRDRWDLDQFILCR